MFARFCCFFGVYVRLFNVNVVYIFFFAFCISINVRIMFNRICIGICIFNIRFCIIAVVIASVNSKVFIFIFGFGFFLRAFETIKDFVLILDFIISSNSQVFIGISTLLLIITAIFIRSFDFFRFSSIFFVSFLFDLAFSLFSFTLLLGFIFSGFIINSQIFRNIFSRFILLKSNLYGLIIFHKYRILKSLYFVSCIKSNVLSDFSTRRIVSQFIQLYYVAVICRCLHINSIIGFCFIYVSVTIIYRIF